MTQRDPGQRARRTRRWAILMIALLVVYSVGGFAGVPMVIRKFIVPAIDAQLPGSLHIEQSSCNPFAWSLELGPGELLAPDGRKVFAFERVRCNFDPIASLATLSWRFSEVIVTQPSLDVAIDETGSIDLLDALLQKSAKEPEASAGSRAPSAPLLTSIPPIHIAQGRIESASARFIDRSRGQPFEAEWHDATFDFSDLHLSPLRRNDHHFSARSANGARVVMEGALVSEPVSLRGQVHLSGLPIAPFMPYLRGLTTAVIVSGTLDATLNYELAPTDTPPVARATLPSIAIDGLNIMDGKDLLLDAPRLRLVDTHIDLVKHEAVVPSLRMSGAELHLVRDETGQPAILRLFPIAAREAAAIVTNEPLAMPGEEPAYPVERVAAAVSSILRGMAADWSIAIESVGLHDQTVRYTDRSTRRVVELALTQTELTAGPARSVDGFATPLDVRGRLNTRGTLALRGTVRPLATDVDIEVDGQSIDALPFSPFLPPRPVPALAPMELGSGVLSVKGRAQAAVNWATKAISVSWDGAASGADLRVDLDGATTPFASLATLGSEGKLEAMLGSDESLTLKWKGSAGVRSATTALPLATRTVAGSLGEADTNGALEIGITSSEGLTTNWSGDVELGDFNVKSAAEGRPTALGVRSLRYQGIASTALPPMPIEAAASKPLLARNEGTLVLRGVEAAATIDGTPASVAFDEATIDGATELTSTSGNDADFAWGGKFESRTVSLRQGNASGDAKQAGAMSISFEGELGASLQSGAAASTALRSQGLLNLTKIALSQRNSDGAATVGFDGVRIDGETKAKLDGNGSAAGEWTGALELNDLVAELAAPAPRTGSASVSSIRYAGVAQANVPRVGALQFRSEGGLLTDLVALHLSTPEIGTIDFAATELGYAGQAGAQTPSGLNPPRAVLFGVANGRAMTLAVPSIDGAQLRVDEWSATGIDVDSERPRAVIGEVIATGAHAELTRVIIPPYSAARGDGPEATEASSMDAASARIDAQPTPASPSNSPLAALPRDGGASLPELTLTTFRLDDGSLLLTDPSTSPPSTLRVSGVKVEIDDLGTRQQGTTRVAINGLVQDAAQFDFHGTLRPFDIARETVLEFSMTSLPLKPYDPYANRFVGYQVESGRLTIKVPVTVRDAALDGNLDASLDRFFLGRETPSPEAPNLPIKLGLDLLRDANERIAVNLPFKGDLNDPEFRLDGIIWQAIVNLLVKATTAPFTLLGSLVGAGDRDLSTIAFEPGSAELTPERVADLDLLAKALLERPALVVRAIGQRTDVADREGMRRTALRERLRNDAKVKPGADFAADAYENAVRRAFRELPSREREVIESAAGGKPSLTAMEDALMAGIVIADTQIEALARARAEAVVRALTTGVGVPAERVSAEAGTEPVEGAPRVIFELK